MSQDGKRIHAISAFLILSTLTASAALGQYLPPAATAPLPAQYDIPAVRAARNACLADVLRLCPEVTPGGGRIVRCLAAQRERVSPICRDAIMTAKAAIGY